MRLSQAIVSGILAGLALAGFNLQAAAGVINFCLVFGGHWIIIEAGKKGVVASFYLVLHGS